MTASHIRADMFSEFIRDRHSSPESRKAAAHPDHTHHDTAQREPLTPESFQTDSIARDVLGDRSTLQGQPLLQLLQALALNGGRMCMKSLLVSQVHPKLDTLRLLDQLKKLDFIEITTTPDQDMVQLTTLGRWAAKYAD